MGLCDLNHRKQSCRKPGCKQLCQMDQTSAQQPSLLKEGPMDVKAKAHSLTPVTLTESEKHVSSKCFQLETQKTKPDFTRFYRP
ncbi:uncharacterized protein ACIBXB_012501 isoform 2-T2 [Morphnus guianensis]